ncbi:MAG: hypothetical protein MHM6MM_009112 [Cercozoa sp. M6MM]
MVDADGRSLERAVTATARLLGVSKRSVRRSVCRRVTAIPFADLMENNKAEGNNKNQEEDQEDEYDSQVTIGASDDSFDDDLRQY